MALYTVARLAYAVAYIVVERERYSPIRSAFWWVGNVCCLKMLWLAAKKG